MWNARALRPPTSAHTGLSVGFALGVFLAAAPLQPAMAACTEPFGDVTQDGIVSVVDVQCAALTALSILLGPTEPLPPCLAGTAEEADVNCTPPFAITDVQLVVQAVLGAVLSPALDGDANGCPDACEVEPCGNGSLDPGEQCDDGNAFAGDGCSELCSLEGGLLSIISPAEVPPTLCATSGECTANGVCIDGICTRGWGTASIRAIRVEALSLPIQGQTVRVCANVDLGGSPCAAGGFIVGQAPLTAGTAEVPLSSLPQGNFLFTAEVQTAPGSSTWVSSLANPTGIFRQRLIAIDLTPPSVLGFTTLSDTLPPVGTLNAAEQEEPRTFRFAFASNEHGSVRLTAEQQTKVNAAVTAGVAAEALVKLNVDGAKSVSARAYDLVGNASAPVALSFVVDTLAPLAVIAYPDRSPIAAGQGLDVLVQTGPGATVMLYDGEVPIGETVATAGGIATFFGALTDGQHSFTVTAVDAAQNLANAATIPAVVVVDTIAPSVDVTAPVAGTLGPADDAALESGFQAVVSFSSPAALSWKISLRSGCTEDFSSCGAAVLKAAGANAAEGPVAVSTAITLPLVASPYYLVDIALLDAVGNAVSQSIPIVLDLGECTISLTGLPADGVFNASDCADPGCTSVFAELTVVVSPGCAGVDAVGLTIDGAPGGEHVITPEGTVTFAIPLADGDEVQVEATALSAGVPVVESGGIALLADLTPPSITFVAAEVGGVTTPATGDDVAWGVSSDLDPASPGLQHHLRLEGSDASSTGTLVSIALVNGSSATPLAGVATPKAIQAWPLALNLLYATFPDAAEGELVATVEDAAGNQSTTFFSVSIDLVPPAAVVLAALEPSDIHPRLPAVTLRWTAPADDGVAGNAAVAYDVRYSREVIDSEESFELACPAEDVVGTGLVPIPAAPGSAEEYTLSGPDPRPAGSLTGEQLCKWAPRTDGGGYYFAVRAVDDAGNRSPLEAGSVAWTGALALRFATVSAALAAPNPVNFERYVYAVGDVNADGLGDVAIGGRDSHGFCVLFGRGTGGPVADIAVDTTSSPTHQCFLDATETGLGSPVIPLGDVNGDGIDDFAAGAGGFGGPDSAEELRVFLGAADNPLSTTPALIIRGTHNGIAFGLSAAGEGNFNGDTSSTGAPLMDIALGSRNENRAYVVPGAETWPAAALDLSNPADRVAFGAVSIDMVDAPAASTFGFRVAFAGDALVGDGLGCDDLAITQSKGLGQVVLLRGRPTVGTSLSVRVTQGWSGAEPGDAESVRLLQEVGSSKSAFGAGLAAADLDADGIPEVIVNHPTNARVHVFRGAALQNKLGASARISATGAFAYDGVVLGTNGWLLAGAFDGVAPAGNFDGDSLVPGGTVDLLYGDFDLFLQNYGQVFVRINAGLDADGSQLGLLPWEDLIVEEPIPTASPDRFGTTVVPAGDFNGDGRPDFIVGTEGRGYSVLVY